MTVFLKVLLGVGVSVAGGLIGLYMLMYLTVAGLALFAAVSLNRAFCRGGFCFVLGAVAWLFRWAFRLVAFCVMSVLGLHGDGEPDVPEESPSVPGNQTIREVDQIPRIRR